MTIPPRIRRRLRRDSRGVSPAIGTVLMVAMTVVFAMILMYVIMPMLRPPVEGEEEQWVLKQNAAVENGPNDWDTSFTVMKIKSDERMPWSTISFAVQEHSGSYITDATIDYGDMDGDGNVQEGDSIILEGMTDAYDGATLKMLYKGQLLTQATISFISG